MSLRWNILPPPPQSFYDEHPELPKIVAHLLYHRNLRTQEAIDEFLNPDYSQDVHDPYLFKDMVKTVERLFLAIENKEKITIYGDYDADGVSGATILTSLFRAFEHTNYDVFLPHREIDGYGLNMNSVKKLHEQGTKIIITCDCGISNTKEVELANELGMEVIITDHHSIPAVLPPAFAIIHPKIEGETYPDKGLAGGGVAFKLTQAMLAHHKKTNELLPNGEKHDAFEKWLLDMVAIASVGDMVPLVGESRTLTKFGLIVLNKTKRIGLYKMLVEARLIADDGSKKYEFDADTIGFQIAPRINAAGRMEHANVAYNLLVAEKATDAIDLAFRLDQNNVERQELTKQYVKEATEQIERDQKDAPFLFVFGKKWSPGIVGLIASRIKEKYHKPTFAMAMNDGEIMGSGRSIEGFDMIGAMQEVPECFMKFGGHPMACGFTLKNPEILEEFKEKMIAKFNEKTKGIDLTPTLKIDAEIALEDVTWELYDLLDKFAPFGQANPKPKYVAYGLTVTDLKPMGKTGEHLRIMVSHKTPKIRKTIGWRLCTEDGVNWGKALKPGDKLDMVFEIGVNEWNGNRELQLTIVDLKKSESV